MQPTEKKKILDTQLHKKSHQSKEDPRSMSELQYEGSTHQGMKHGLGILKSGNQVIYSGNFAFDLREGKGQSFNGTRTYSGNWKNDLKHGVGKIQFQNGDFYRGNFVSGKKHGFGVCRERNTFYVGQWENELRQGEFLSFDLSSGSAYEIWYEDNTQVYTTRLNHPQLRTEELDHTQNSFEVDQSLDLKNYLQRKIKEIKEILQSQSSELFTESRLPKTLKKNNNLCNSNSTSFYSGKNFLMICQ